MTRPVDFGIFRIILAGIVSLLIPDLLMAGDLKTDTVTAQIVVAQSQDDTGRDPYPDEEDEQYEDDEPDCE